MVIIVLLDAFRYNYIDNSFLPFLKGSVRGSLIPSFGFEPDTAYFNGAFPDEVDGGAHYWFDPKGSQFRFTKGLTHWLDRLPEKPELVLRKVIQKIAEKRIGNHVRLSTARIPFEYLHYFDITVKKLPFELDSPSKPTIFDLLRQNRKRWFFHGSPLYRVNSESVLKRVRDELYPPYDFTFLHIGDLDKVGHQYGPDSKEMEEALRRVSHSVEEIYKIVEARFDEAHWIIFGDHGMTEVKQKPDIWSGLKRLDLIMGKDYVFFLDSTMARFWFFNGKAGKRLRDFLDGLDGGHILTEQEKAHYHINYPHNKFGDIVFLADPGVLIYPNFFQNRRCVKGMHGYVPEFRDQQSAFLILSSRIKTPKVFKEPVDMQRLFPTILDLLGIDIPDTCDVPSLL